MSTDHVKLGHLFAEIVSGHDVSRFDKILAPGYVSHNPFAEPGPEGVKKVFGAIIAGVPDLKVFAEDVFGSADGTRVVGR
jgi:predicted SnoaL-like aldol condensation-catalyzing enzyme